MAADVSLTVRVSGAPEAIAAIRQVSGQTAEFGKEAERTSRMVRAQTASFSESRQELRALSITARAAADVASSFGGEAGRLAGTLDGVAASAMQVSVAVATMRTGWIGTLGVMGVVITTALALRKAQDELSRSLDDLIARGPGWLQWLWFGPGGAPQFIEDVNQATAAIVQMNLFDRQQAEQTAALHKLHFLEESARLDRLAEEQKRAGQKAAAAAKEAAEAVRRVREAAFQVEANAIVQFNIWQREEWQSAADFRKAKFLEVADAQAAALALEIDDIVRFNIWQRQEWEKAAAARRDAFLNLPAPEEALRAVTAFTDGALMALGEFFDWETLQLEVDFRRWQEHWNKIQGQAANFANSLVDTVTAGLVDVLSGAKEFGQGMTDLFQALKRMILQTIITEALEPLQKILKDFFSNLFQGQGLLGTLLGFLPFLFFPFQHGGSMVVSRPTPLMVGETGPERVTVTPLARPFAGAGAGGSTVIFNAPVFLDDITASQLVRRYIRPALDREEARRVG